MLITQIEYSNILIITSLFVLFQLDYYLTLVGYSYYKKYYSKYIELETYELNPILRKAIERGQIIHFKRIFITLVLIIIIILLSILNNFYYQFTVGGIFFLYFYINLRHIGNILLFRHIKNRPEDIEGKIRINLVFSLKQANLTNIQLALILLIATVLTENTYLLGGTITMIIATIYFYLIYLRVKRKSKKKNLG